MLNVTVTQPQGPGFVTVYPCGSQRPTASSINYAPGQTIANAVVAKLGIEGKVCLYTHVTTHLVVDLGGFYPTGTGYVATNPGRLLETRSGEPVGTVDGVFQGLGLLSAGTTIELQVTGRAGVPPSATAAVLNVTVTQPAAPGFVTVFRAGFHDRPHRTSTTQVDRRSPTRWSRRWAPAAGSACTRTPRLI